MTVRPARSALWGLLLLLGCTGDARLETVPPLEHARILADDAMEGRGLGSPGYRRAVDYAVGALADAGLRPAFRDEGGAPSFRQALDVIRYRFGEGTRGLLRTGERVRELGLGRELIVFRPGTAPGPVRGGLAFVGHGLTIPELGRDDPGAVDLDGRWAVLLEGDPADPDGVLPERFRDFQRNAQTIVETCRADGAVGIVLILEPGAYAAWSAIAAQNARTSHAAAERYACGAQADSDIPIVLLDAESLAELFRGSGHAPPARTGDERPCALPGASLEVVMDARRDVVRTWNVGGFAGPDAAEGYAVLSAHLDHLGVVEGRIHNGANDDASGCGVVLSAARRLAEAPPARPVLCLLFAAEETGHFGSLHFVRHRPPGPFLGVLNLEHAGRADDGTFLTTTSAGLRSVIESVAAEAGGAMRFLDLDPRGRMVQGADNFSFHLAGLPHAIMAGGGFPEYHTPDDDVDRLDPALLGRALDLSLEILHGIVAEEGSP